MNPRCLQINIDPRSCLAGLNFGISNVMYYRFMVLRSTHKIEKFQEVLTVNSPERSLTFNRSGIISFEKLFSIASPTFHRAEKITRQ